jgi:ComF family protein
MFLPIKRLYTFGEFMLNRLIDSLFPPVCLICAAMEDVENGVCNTCKSQMNKIPEPVCDICGQTIGTSGICLACLDRTPDFEKILAIFTFDGKTREAIHAFKYNGKTGLKKYFGKLVQQSIIKSDIRPDVITFIPMHWTRLLVRGYNQSALIAGELAKLTGIRADFDALEKIRNTKTQAGLDRKARHKNIKGSFLAKRVKGLNVLVVDDVITTGETARAAARALKDAGADKVFIAGIGRTMPW